MSLAVALDASPITVLRTLRGPIVGARIAYPQVLHVEVRDSADGLWRLATQDANWSPADPSELIGQSISDAEIGYETGELRLQLSSGTSLTIVPGRREAADDPPSWELITPAGLALQFGPGMRWQIASAYARPLSGT